MMAILDSSEANILDVETVNWRYVVYPVVVAVVLGLGALTYYYNQQQKRDAAETAARSALILAKTPEALLKVADDFPGTDNATLALLAAAEESFSKLDHAAAIKDYQRVIDNKNTVAILAESARLGLGSALEASGKLEEATTTYLEVAHRNAKSPYAPYAYVTAARLAEQRGDKDAARKILSEAIGLSTESPFITQAKTKLKELTETPVPPAPTAPAGTAPVPAVPTVTPPVPAVPTPVAPTVPKHP